MKKHHMSMNDISPVIWVITVVILLITLLITNHEPPSSGGEGRAGSQSASPLLASTPTLLSPIWEFPKIRGASFWGAYNKDPTI